MDAAGLRVGLWFWPYHDGADGSGHQHPTIESDCHQPADGNLHGGSDGHGSAELSMAKRRHHHFWCDRGHLYDSRYNGGR